LPTLKVLHQLTKIRAPQKFRAAAMKIALQYITAEKLEELTAIFRKIDASSSGFITPSDLAKSMDKIGLTEASR
jgi:Ca2+-binding EF-hand superfamily protein